MQTILEVEAYCPRCQKNKVYYVVSILVSGKNHKLTIACKQCSHQKRLTIRNKLWNRWRENHRKRG